MKNWIERLNDFYTATDAEPISPKAASLYGYLLYRFNRVYWAQPLKIRLYALADATKQSLFSIKAARRELVERGLIRYESGGGSASAAYYLTDDEEEKDT